MSHSIRNFASAGVVGGASGLLKSWLGMASSSVATAKSSRSLRLRDCTIELDSARFDRSSFRRSARPSSDMSSATATSVFNQTDGDVDLN
jgi:hypothetical protein